MDKKEKIADINFKLIQAEKMSKAHFLPKKKKNEFIKLVKTYKKELKKLK